MNLSHSFDSSIAKKYGIHEAIIIQSLRYWIAKNKAEERNFNDGRTWTYMSIKGFVKYYPYLTIKQIRTTLDNLVKYEIVITGNYNQNTHDRTLWYSLIEENIKIDEFTDLPPRANAHDHKGKSNLPLGQIEMTTKANRNDQGDKCITDTKTITKTDTKTITNGFSLEPISESSKKNEPNVFCDQVISSFISITGKKIKLNDGRKKLILGRMKDGYVLTDFENVIYKKYNQWKDDRKMKEFITPETLFAATNFTKYVEQDEIKQGSTNKPDTKTGPTAIIEKGKSFGY